MSLNIRMIAGNGDTSYTNNSAYQRTAILKSEHVLDDALKDMIAEYNNGSFPKCFRMADLGCSSGPNTLFIVARIIDKIQSLCKEKNSPDQFEVFLNDLPENDFNNLFKMLPEFYQKLKNDQRPPCFISGLPGSFYGRLFPSKSLNLVYSSYSLHWLSKVPEGLESNRENIHMAMTSPPEVIEAYARQFRTDFSSFLSSRAQEIMPGGRMVLTLAGRAVADPSLRDECAHFKLLANTLLDMVAEGLVKEADLHTFNIPIYTPSKQEAEALILGEGSFSLERLDDFLIPWDPTRIIDYDHNGHSDNDDLIRGQMLANIIRAYTEPVVVGHFGSSIVDELYKRYGKKLADHFSREKPLAFNIVICLSKR